jgi:hypothetical protein
VHLFSVDQRLSRYAYLAQKPVKIQWRTWMSDWSRSLPIAGRAVVVFGARYLATAAIYWLVMSLAVGERARAFKSVSPGMLPPLGIPDGVDLTTRSDRDPLPQRCAVISHPAC